MRNIIFWSVMLGVFWSGGKTIEATNLLSNPSFTSGSVGWTLATTTYDSTYYQDSAGSLRTLASGKNANVTGTAEQTLGTSIEVGSTVALSLKWSKTCINSVCSLNTVRVDIAKPSALSTWVTIWSETSTPAVGSTTAWTGPASLDISSYFTESGIYKIRTFVNVRTGNNSSNRSAAWLDNLNLDVVSPQLNVGSTGSQVNSLEIGSTNNYLGGAFTFVRSGGTASVTQIILSENGTVNATDNLSNIDLYYEIGSTCNYDGNESLFGTASSFNASQKATISGSLSVGTSQICFYPVLDIGPSASGSQTLDIGISNPLTDVSVSSGSVLPMTSIDIGGTTSLNVPTIISISMDSDGSIDYGLMAVGSNRSTLEMEPHETQVIENDGNTTVNINIKGQNTACPWILSGTIGTNQYIHEFSLNSGTLWSTLTTSYQTMSAYLGVGKTLPFDLRLWSPSSTGCFDQQHADITIQAVSS